MTLFRRLMRIARPERALPTTIRSHVYWSIYVRNKDKGRVKQVHLPPIEDKIGAPDFPWQFFKEEDNPNEIRLIGYHNREASTVEELVLSVLRQAYRLGNDWSIGGLRDLDRQELKYVYGIWNSPRPAPRPPALTTMMFEIQPGFVSPVGDGGMGVDGTDRLFYPGQREL